MTIDGKHLVTTVVRILEGVNADYGIDNAPPKVVVEFHDAQNNVSVSAEADLGSRQSKLHELSLQ